MAEDQTDILKRITMRLEQWQQGQAISKIVNMFLELDELDTTKMIRCG